MRTTLFFAALLIAPATAMAQGPGTLDPKSKSELLATRETAWRAWFAGDRAALDAMLPAEFIGIGWGAGPWGTKTDELRESAAFAQEGGKLTSLEFPRTEIQVYGDVAIVYSTYRVGLTSGGGEMAMQEGRATEVFIRRGGRWLHPGWHLDSVK